MARAIWSGVIGFGMVSIPVKLYSATSSKSISFHLLHEKCHTRIKELRWCPHCDRQVDYDELVRGYEYAKGEYVVVTDEDMEKLPLASKNLISVDAFVKAAEIDPIYFNGSYYLEPDKAAARPFALLMQALEEKEMVGIGTIALRNKERLCALRVVGGTILIEMLLYPDEIRLDLDKTTPATKLNKNELQMATTLVELMTQKFEPQKYKDRYREAMSELIEAKLEGQEVVAEKAPAQTKVVDLMDALRASVERARGGKSASRKVKPPEETAQQDKAEKQKRSATAGESRKRPAAVANRRHKPATVSKKKSTTRSIARKTTTKKRRGAA
jgi:DNA end-binding protein Ku